MQLNGVASELSEMNGYDVETGGKPFDPLGLSDMAPLDSLRESELKHGRVAMLAFLGWVFPEVVGTFPANDITSTHAWEALSQADPQFWFQIVGVCGIVEAAGFRQVLPLPRSSPTDPHPSLFALAFAAAEYRHKISGAEGPFFDPAGIAPKDPAEFKKMQLKELKVTTPQENQHHRRGAGDEDILC
eukprot:scaffold2448_cov250-Pinguiococcus_pyrenoidosus.AAC.8